MLGMTEDSKLLLQIGAWPSVLIGALYVKPTARLLFAVPHGSFMELLFLITYTLAAFVP